MKILLLLLALIAGAVRAEQPHTLTGDIRTHKSFPSLFLGRDRDILVYLPPGYETDPSRRYPVLYLHDGQNLFDGATSFIPGQEWRADETAQALIEQGRIRPLIIVGIYNTDRRVDDYTQSFSWKLLKGGNADLYGRMIAEELKPFIDRTYRTLPNDTGLGGSSLGGLVSLHLGITYPELFTRLAVISPSVWWGDRHLLREVEALPEKTAARIWVDIGTQEGSRGEETVEETRMLRDALVAKGWVLDQDLGYFEDEGAHHNEAAWAGRFDRVLQFLYPP